MNTGAIGMQIPQPWRRVSACSRRERFNFLAIFRTNRVSGTSTTNVKRFNRTRGEFLHLVTVLNSPAPHKHDGGTNFRPSRCVRSCAAVDAVAVMTPQLQRDVMHIRDQESDFAAFWFHFPPPPRTRFSGYCTKV